MGRYHMKLFITHVPTGYSVSFPAFLEMFSDAFTQQWNSEDVYGRMDPIATFINTRRALSIAWNVPASSFENAQSNLNRMNKLMSFMYPLYSAGGAGATAINQSPLLRIKFGNLIVNPNTGEGLLGYVNGFTFDPELEAGMFHNLALKDNGDPEYYPKTFRLNCEFNVLHEHELGFTGKDGDFRWRGASDDTNSFPALATYPYDLRDFGVRELSVFNVNESIPQLGGRRAGPIAPVEEQRPTPQPRDPNATPFTQGPGEESESQADFGFGLDADVLAGRRAEIEYEEERRGNPIRAISSPIFTDRGEA